jgi:excinuclease ABC subunit A
MLLAPVVRERKGEYTQLFEQLQGQGFVRARVDGEIIDIDTPPELDKKKKHTIEVVVDRFKVRDDLGNRIAESFETALRLGSDIAVLSWMNGEHPERVFSAKHSCPECDRAVAELEPRLFSFNNPFGACPVCDGLGTRSHFSAEKLIPNPEVSISQGAIRGWDRQRPYYYTMLQKVADHFSIDLDQPWNSLDKDTQKKFLQGTGKEKIDLSYIDERGRKHSRVQAFEGILPHLERRYRETESIMCVMISHNIYPMQHVMPVMVHVSMKFHAMFVLKIKPLHKSPRCRLVMLKTIIKTSILKVPKVKSPIKSLKRFVNVYISWSVLV